MTLRSKEREKTEEVLKAKSPSLLTLLAPSILSICLSIICLCGLTWAWFADSVSNNLGSIETGSVQLEFSYEKIQQNVQNSEKTQNTEETKSCITVPREVFQSQAAAQSAYHISVTNKGTVNGYIVISNSLNDKKYVAKIEPDRGGQDNSIEFGIACKTEAQCDIQIEGYWGTWETKADYETYLLLEDVDSNEGIALLSAYDVSGSDAAIRDDAKKTEVTEDGLESLGTSEEHTKDVSAGDVSGNDAISFAYPVIVIE